jgi:hypothetical protein
MRVVRLMLVVPVRDPSAMLPGPVAVNQCGPLDDRAPEGVRHPHGLVGAEGSGGVEPDPP